MMTEQELAALIDQAERDSITNSGDFNNYNEKLFKYYQSEPFGDELEGRSQVVTSDVADIVESDMPSLVRIFLSGNDVVEFKPTAGVDVAEAEEKNIYIPWLLRNTKDYFRKMHGWLKQTEIQSLGILEYGIRDERKTEVKSYEGLSQLEIAQLMIEFESDPEVSSVEIVGQDFVGDEQAAIYDIDIRLTRGKQEYFIDNIANEDIIISRNAQTKDDADIVGKRFRKSRGDLIAEGFDEDLVKSLPIATPDDDSSAKQERYRRQGGEYFDNGIDDWPNQMVEGYDVYAKIDYDEDGIPERRHIIKIGNRILENEPFEHVPYAICSAVLMPLNIVGKSRAEQGLATQKVNSTLTRNVLDNIYSVNNPGMVVNDDVINMDDLLTQRPNRVVRADASVVGNYAPLETPYIGDKALQVIQYMDSLQARRTGSQLAAQGLDADSLHKETATRFEGVRDAGAAKTELVARVIAETGFKDLYEGLAWFATHYQDEAKEIYVLGKTLTVDPSAWKYDHFVEAVVGTGAGDNEKTLETLSGIYALQLQQKESGSTLSDDKKIYNTLEKIVKASGLNRADRYFNDPEQPLQTIFAENQLLKQQLQMLTQQMEDPLSKAEKIKQQGSIARDQMKYQHETQMKAVDVAQENKELSADLMMETAKLELEYNADINNDGSIGGLNGSGN